jgi:formamidopyrimidine-DNA glycosylase
MPELPEVESVRRSLEPAILGRRVTAVVAVRPDYLTPPGAPLARLLGHAFTPTLRHGKKLFCPLDDGQTLLFHLGMTGFLEVAASATPPEPHTHLILALDDGRQLRMSDPRRFGGVWYYPSLAAALAAEVENKLGPDALIITAEHLAERWHAAPSAATLKARLLGQKDIAGLGNIYVDEALWQARLHPLQRVRRLRSPEIARLVSAIHEVLNRSIRLGGTTIRDYRNADGEPGQFARQLSVYGRGGQPCRACQALLIQQTLAGRTTVYCKSCQRRH